MRDREILHVAGVKQYVVAQALGFDPSSVTKRFKKAGDDGKAFLRKEWILIIEFLQQESQPLSETLRRILVQEGRLDADSIPSIRVRSHNKISLPAFDGVNMIDVCKQIASAGIESLSMEDLLYLSSAWRTIGGEFNVELTVKLLEHRKKKTE